MVDLEVDAIAGVLVVAARGDLVGGAVQPLQECLAKASDAGRPVVLDLLAVQGIDHEAVALLSEAHQRLSTRLRLAVERRGPVHLTLKDAGLAQTLALHWSVASALSAATPPSGAGRFGRPALGRVQ